jgi:hypothetical protein
MMFVMEYGAVILEHTGQCAVIHISQLLRQGAVAAVLGRIA